MTKTEILKNQYRHLKLTAFSCELGTVLQLAEKNKISYLELIAKMVNIEIGKEENVP